MAPTTSGQGLWQVLLKFDQLGLSRRMPRLTDAALFIGEHSLAPPAKPPLLCLHCACVVVGVLIVVGLRAFRA